MSLDHVAAVEADGRRILAALERDRGAAIPWSDDGWTVQACAQHVGGAHHVVGRVIAGRPTTTFDAFAELHPPHETDPALGAWVAEGTAFLVDQLRTVDHDEPAWSWWPPGSSVGFWARRMAHETQVHRWDVELGAGVDAAPADPEIAADGIDEFLDVFVGVSRQIAGSPGAGEAIAITCTDTDGCWVLRFPAPRERTVERGDGDADLRLTGPAEGLLLHLWGRRTADAAGVEVAGDADVAMRWREFVPAM